jgi:hypothetical protein
MSPLMQQTLESKNERRKRLIALPYPEKVRIVEKMRAATREIHSAQRSSLTLREESPAYGANKP